MTTETKPKVDKKRERIAYLFFDVIVRASAEGGAPMLYDTWENLPDDIKENYLKEADKVLSII